ncbi:GGDEF domain-containing protein [Pseudobowmanella zhangzhouensis]|uniref:GGDEF domain-containing protein n=1 Tax=Pseudobowmanella zhangzhouensis TaxID=1537679 RepID=UPI003608A7F5
MPFQHHSDDQQIKHTLNIARRRVIITVCMVIITPFLSIWLFYAEAQRTFKSDFLDHINEMATVAANLIDPVQHAYLANQTQLDKSIADMVLQPLAQLHRSLKDVHYVSTLTIENNTTFLILDTAWVLEDGDTAYVLEASDFREEFPPQDEFDYESYAVLSEGKNYIFTHLYTDEYGTFIAAAAPIPRVGDTPQAFVILEINAATLLAREQQLSRNLMISCAAALVIIGTILLFMLRNFMLMRQAFTLIGEQRDEFQQRSLTDPLTGIFNRRAFDLALQREMSDDSDYLALIMFDIDHFKQVNDTHGHDVGDLVLQDLALLVESHIRNHDVFARTGGEEFTIISRHRERKGAWEQAEKLREIVAYHDVHFNGGSLTVTISAGLHLINYTEQPADALKAADTALYLAKQNGRNRVEQS